MIFLEQSCPRLERRKVLKITVFSTAAATTLKLEGALTGRWLDELKNCWAALRASVGRRPLRLDISDLTHTSFSGIELLRSLYEDGAHLVAGGDARTCGHGAFSK